MNDLISRRALCEYALNQKNKSVTPNDIMRFPSAQLDIITCKDCKYTDECEPIADGRYWCVLHGTFMYYCSDAERRSDDKQRCN